MAITYNKEVLENESEESLRNWKIQNTTFHQKMDDFQRFYLEYDGIVAITIVEEYGRRVPKIGFVGPPSYGMDAVRAMAEEYYYPIPLADG